MTDSYDEIVFSPDLMPPTIPPHGEKLHEVEQHQKHGDARQRVNVIRQCLVVAKVDKPDRYIPLAEANLGEREKDGELEKEYQVFHGRESMYATMAAFAILGRRLYWLCCLGRSLPIKGICMDRDL